MSSSKKRHVVYDIGAVAEDDSSDDFDLSSCTNAIVHMTRSSDNNDITVRYEATPIPPGESTHATDDWYTLYNVGLTADGVGTMGKLGFLWDTAEPAGLSVLFATGQTEVQPTMDLRAPRRARISIESTSDSLTSVLIEGTRVIA